MKKYIKNIYQIISVIVFFVGVFFSIVVSEVDDAPGFVVFGTAASAFICSFLYGYGILIESVKNNNKLLKNIYNEIKIQNKE